MGNLARISNTELHGNMFDMLGYVFLQVSSDSGDNFDNYFRNAWRNHCSSSLSLLASTPAVSDIDNNYNVYRFKYFLNELIGGFVSESAFLDRLFVDKPSATSTLDG